MHQNCVGRGLDFEEVRQYVKGDDIRNIDWKVTARNKKDPHTGFQRRERKTGADCCGSVKINVFRLRQSEPSRW
jgi:hypothetical protein